MKKYSGSARMLGNMVGNALCQVVRTEQMLQQQAKVFDLEAKKLAAMCEESEKQLQEMVEANNADLPVDPLERLEALKQRVTKMNLLR